MPRFNIKSKKINNKVKIRQMLKLGRSIEQIKQKLKVTTRDIEIEQIKIKNK